MRRSREPCATAFAKSEQAEGDWAEGDQPGMLPFLDAHELADKSLAEKHQLTAPFDLAIGAHPTNLRVGA